jgi:hypothetical protein
MIYVACPYSDPDAAVREARFRAKEEPDTLILQVKCVDYDGP